MSVENENVKLTIIEDEEGRKYLKVNDNLSLGPFVNIVFNEALVKYRCFKAFIKDDEYIIMTFDGRQIGEKKRGHPTDSLSVEELSKIGIHVYYEGVKLISQELFNNKIDLQTHIDL